MNNLKIWDNFCLCGNKNALFLWLYRRDVTASSYVTQASLSVCDNTDTE